MSVSGSINKERKTEGRLKRVRGKRKLGDNPRVRDGHTVPHVVYRVNFFFFWDSLNAS